MFGRRGLTLATCCTVHGLQDGLAYVLYVLLPVIAQAFGLSYAQIGTIRAASAGAMTLFEVPSGMLAERVGERALLVFGLLVVGLGYGGLALAGSYPAVLGALFVAGFGAAFQHALNSGVITRSYEGAAEGAARRAALGVYNGAGDVGKLGFTGLFALLTGLGLAWQGIVAGFALAAILASGAVLVALTRLGAGGARVTRPGAAAPAPSGWGVRDAVGFTALGAIVFLDIAVQGGFLTFLAFLMIERGLDAGLGALAVVLTLAGGVLGKFSCGFLAGRLGVIRALVLVECLTALGILAVVVLPSLAALALLPVVGAVLQGSSSITYGAVGDFVHDGRQSRGFAVIYTVSSAAGIAAPVGFGLIGDRFGLSATMLVMAGVVLAPLALCPLMRRAVTRGLA